MCIRDRVIGFYNQDEISAAKHMLFQIADKLHSAHGSKQHRMVTRKGNNRKAADTEDIVNLLSDLDVIKIGLNYRCSRPQTYVGSLRLFQMPLTSAR